MCLKHNYTTSDARQQALVAQRGNKPVQNTSYNEDISEDDSIFDLLASPVADETECNSVINNFDLDAFHENVVDDNNNNVSYESGNTDVGERLDFDINKLLIFDAVDSINDVGICPTPTYLSSVDDNSDDVASSVNDVDIIMSYTYVSVFSR